MLVLEYHFCKYFSSRWS